MPAPRMLMILSENTTMSGGDALPTLVRWARTAEDAGFDAVMASEHVVMGRDAGADGVMGNPRAYAMPGNQDVYTHWPNSLALLASIASVTSTVRLVASAVLAPLRHPLLLAREFGTLDLLSEGRLVMQPSVSWSRDEYAALGVPFEQRGRILDEQLTVLERAWAPSPLSFHGAFYDFDDVYFEPKAYRPDGPRMWFGGQSLNAPVLRRLVRYGHGFHPLGEPSAEDYERLDTALAHAGRQRAELELVGGTRAVFADDIGCADLGRAMAAIPEQLEKGFTTFCLKPSQFIDDGDDLPRFCREVMQRAEAMTG